MWSVKVVRSMHSDSEQRHILVMLSSLKSFLTLKKYHYGYRNIGTESSGSSPVSISSTRLVAATL